MKIVRRGAAADIQPAHDLPAEIVGHEVKQSVRAGGSLLILIGHRGEENGLLFAHQRFIVGVKAVDDRLELRRKREVIDRRGDEKQITCRPADLLENELDKIEKEMIQYKKQDEDVLTYALFPQVATDFFKYREAQDKKVDVTLADKDSTAYPV